MVVLATDLISAYLPLGPQGIQGIQGTTASQGIQGIQGRQGIQGLAGVGLTWSVKTSNYTAQNLDAIVGNTAGGAFSITLPATPTTGTMIAIADGSDWSVNNLTVLRNGSTIEDIAEDLVLDINDVRVDFVYSGTTWQVYANIGQRGVQGLTGAGVQGLQGITGAGLQGLQGLQGVQGITGSQGTQGLQGVQGIQGRQGITGVGNQGIQGTQGIAGGGGSSITISNDTTTNATRYVSFVDTTSGTATALTVSSSKLYFNPSTGTLNATLFNSLSDETLKTDLTQIGDAVSLINKIQGFRFKWKEGGEDSMGVSAQEVEQVLPELVSNDTYKTVNYNGIIAVLIEAVKELSKEIKNK